MNCPSILYEKEESPQEASSESLHDLRLDRVFDRIIASRERHNLKPFFLSPLKSGSEINFRQDVAKDIEKEEIFGFLKDFSKRMERVDRLNRMIEKLDYEYNKKGWILENAILYSESVENLLNDLENSNIESEGLRNFRDFLRGHVNSEEFRSLVRESKEVKKSLSEIRYSLVIEPGKFSVKKFEGEENYAPTVEEVFSKFKDSECNQYEFEIAESHGMNHIEAAILDFVVKLYPEPFEKLDEFIKKHDNFLNRCVLKFERELQFYLSYFEFIVPLRDSGFPFCYPKVSEIDKNTYANDMFDIALAMNLGKREKVVTNSFYLNDPERIIIVTGPNQGGKTTFARTFGQLHYLASLGLPIPASSAKLLIPDEIFTHFERQEELQSLRSKLEDDLVRAKDIVEKATERSVVVMNEVFSSAALLDMIELSKKILDKILKKDCIGVWVTFADELTRYSDKIVSMVAQVDPVDPSVRTFKIIRKPSNGLAYAVSIAEKYNLTYEKIKERVIR